MGHLFSRTMYRSFKHIENYVTSPASAHKNSFAIIGNNVLAQSAAAAG